MTAESQVIPSAQAVAAPGLAGTSAAVTGAGRGIGRAIAMLLARSGVNVLVSDLDGDSADRVCDEIRALGVESVAVRADVREADDNARIVQAAAHAFGRLDLMVCNAGIVHVKPMLELSADEWDGIFAVNTRGVFLGIQAASRQMRTQPAIADGRPRGKIVATASIAGRAATGPLATMLGSYRATKAAVISTVQSSAWALSPDVTVNAVCPGIVDTDMWDEIDRRWCEITGAQPGSAKESRAAAIPMRRVQHPDDVANVVGFLASPAADYVTGQSVHIDGGIVMS
ncbi:MAG: glucose 1-dehydrogenase [Burkholderiaceae bacterium]|nr:glucose 1-dehydrogenase [Burkholderiaceae bacterium]